MKTIKLIVTHKRQLSRKYSDSDLKKIKQALASLAQKDKSQGILTHIVHLDDAADMAKYGLSAVTGAVTANKCKKAIDALFVALSPDYLVLLGAGDVIPFFEVPNPSFSDSDGDDDEQVLTDNPYASSRKFVKNKLSSYLIPDRVVGRIPDLPGDHPEVDWLLDYLKWATSAKVQNSQAFVDDLIVCCDEWKTAGADCVAYLSRKTNRLMISPPVKTTAPGALKNRYKARVHMIKCHGAQIDGHFYGQKGEDDYPPVIHSALLKGKTVEGSVVGAMCCYGATTFDPNDPAAVTAGDLPIPSIYLRQGAYGFYGSTTLAWVGFTDMQCADWIVAGALRLVLSGASLGRGLLDSKQNFVKWIDQQGRTPDLAEEKTLLQFLLLGDPSIHLVPAVQTDGPVLASMGAAHVASAALLGSTEERRLRRTVAHSTCEELTKDLPGRKLVRGKKALPKAFLSNLKKQLPNGKWFKFGKPLVHKVERPFQQPELRSAAMRGVTAAGARATPPIARKETFEYYWIARKKTKKAPIVNARMVKVETDKQGAVLRTRVLVSS
jgi:hypothetical protein